MVKKKKPSKSPARPAAAGAAGQKASRAEKPTRVANPPLAAAKPEDAQASATSLPGAKSQTSPAALKASAALPPADEAKTAISGDVPKIATKPANKTKPASQPKPRPAAATPVKTKPVATAAPPKQIKADAPKAERAVAKVSAPTDRKPEKPVPAAPVIQNGHGDANGGAAGSHAPADVAHPFQDFAAETQRMARESFDETTSLLSKIRGAKNPFEIVLLQTSYMQHSLRMYTDFARRVGELMASSQSSLMKQGQATIESLESMTKRP